MNAPLASVRAVATSPTTSSWSWSRYRIGIKEHKGVALVALGAMALTAYGVLAAFQPSHEFGRVLAAYGGVFIVGSMLWGIGFDGFHPDRADILGALICLAGVGVIMYAR
jgi:small multidrug resistance family-3 protein